MNGNHEIIQSLKISNSEIVLGYNPKNTLTPYVTWEYNAENDSYFWGHYFSDEYSAQKDLVSRGNDKIIHYDNIKSNEDTKKQAVSLPDGWHWVNYDDGSGHLQSPDGKDYFSYDWTTGEYKITPDKSYDFFMVENYESGGYSIGSFADFKEYAEKWVKDNVLTRDKSVREVLQEKKDKRNAGITPNISNDIQKSNELISQNANNLERK